MNDEKSEPEEPRRRLQNLRDTLLHLHKALIESERVSYEKAVGPIQSPNHFFHLLTNDPWFVWLSPLSKLIVLLDEALDAKERVTTATADSLLEHVNELLVASEGGHGFPPIISMPCNAIPTWCSPPPSWRNIVDRDRNCSRRGDEADFRATALADSTSSRQRLQFQRRSKNLVFSAPKNLHCSSMSITRREMIKGSVATAALAFSPSTLTALNAAEADSPGIAIPFLNTPPANPKRPMIQWDNLTEWITPAEDFFSVSHYGSAKVDMEKWRLEISGLVKNPKSFSLDQLKSRRRKEVIATLECSGNSSSATFMGAVANARWAGTPLGPLLRECGLKKEGVEAVFFGGDEKVEKIKEKEYPQNFARSMSVTEAMEDKILLAYEMNGQPLPAVHGFPLRLIVPGWYGVAWVKWLNRIEIDDRRFMGRFMARDYVTLRGEELPDCTVWRETSVTRLNIKSIVARAVRLANGTMRVAGAAWTDGTPLQRVELKIDDGVWIPVRLDKKQQSKYAWTFWSYDWKNPVSGEHTLVSRATDANGIVQPTADDPIIKLKKTYYEANQQYPRKIQI